MISVFGTMTADIPHRLGISLWMTSGSYLRGLVIFAAWHRLEGDTVVQRDRYPAARDVLLAGGARQVRFGHCLRRLTHVREIRAHEWSDPYGSANLDYLYFTFG
jgi:hypothetical protein